MATLPTPPSLNLSASIYPSSSSSNFSKSYKLTIHNTPICKHQPLSLNLSKKQSHFITKATETNNEAEIPTTTGTTDEQQQQEKSTSSEENNNNNNSNMTQLGEEIKKAMKERDKEESSGFLSGVVEEIGEIEWPDFGKVVGTTGVVLGVIAGSSLVLLTVNALFAELSDRVFAGRGVQDSFGG